jgi:hypothetical protein
MVDKPSRDKVAQLVDCLGAVVLEYALAENTEEALKANPQRAASVVRGFMAGSKRMMKTKRFAEAAFLADKAALYAEVFYPRLRTATSMNLVRTADQIATQGGLAEERTALTITKALGDAIVHYMTSPRTEAALIKAWETHSPQVTESFGGEPRNVSFFYSTTYRKSQTATAAATAG